MTKANILSVIKAVNKNKDIHWNVLENNKNQITLTNDYDTSIRFEIRLNQGDGNDIKVVDVNGWKENVTYLIQGTEFYSDFEAIEVGIKKAVEAVVKFFYYYY